ncbi:hypothetical protein DRN63_01570 [Nanoarchaeota archaeon]|nr:MAG: hypothetical protein DRN63_01570 [Nanoarchaeota archaeon]
MNGFWNGVLWSMVFGKVVSKRRKCKFGSRRILADAKIVPIVRKEIEVRIEVSFPIHKLNP